ncbi:MAG: isoamylase early set domain-containing protein [Nitrospirae bacterium]|nr:isoamylase early set domain-containing protein [Nitrospirota bacterium]
MYRKKRQTAVAEAGTKLKEKETEKPATAKKNIPTSGFKKVYIEDTNMCRVTFTLQIEAAINARTVAIAGDFNSWNKTSHMMKQSRNGNFTITIDLEAERDYQFKYIVDGERWENDWKADRYDGENSVVVV